VFLQALDLTALDGEDLWREPLVMRKATLSSILRKPSPGILLKGHIENEDGAVVFRHGLEGIVSKLKTSSYGSGRSPDWVTAPIRLKRATVQTRVKATGAIAV
jgi:bifunctional non-homologous end joining protein LigD